MIASEDTYKKLRPKPELTLVNFDLGWWQQFKA